MARCRIIGSAAMKMVGSFEKKLRSYVVTCIYKVYFCQCIVANLLVKIAGKRLAPFWKHPKCWRNRVGMVPMACFFGISELV